MPYLAKIFVYPIKSLDGVEVSAAMLSPGGAIAHDREFAMIDSQGKWVNGKRTAQVHSIRTTYDLAARTVTLREQGQSTPQTFHLDGDRPALEAWLSDRFGYPIRLQQNLQMGFPDDPIASGPTVVSTATLETVAEWFPEITLDEVRRRFRTNLEFADAPPFWEEHLFAEPGQTVAFQVGEVLLEGINPCQRCIVPTRDALTGERSTTFQKEFVAKRQATLPNWATISRFDHFYRLTVNTKANLSNGIKRFRVGDLIYIL